MFDRKTYEKRVEWYQHDRFGMFIHWGLYAIPARGEWVRSTEEMPEDDYLPFLKNLIRWIMIRQNGRKRRRKRE